MYLKKIIKIFIFIASVSFLTAYPSNAQGILLQQPENSSPGTENNTQSTDTTKIPLSNNADRTPDSIKELLKKYEPPQEVTKEKPPELPKNANPDKPYICGSIIFDLTEKEEPITLKETLQIALEKNFDIKVLEQRVEMNKWDYYQTITNWTPDATFTQIIRKNNGEFVVSGIIPDSVVETITQTNFDLSFTASIKKYFDLKTAKYMYKSQKKQLEYTKNQVLKDAATKYYELLRSKKGIEILKTNLEQIKEQLRINKEKLESGIGTKFDVLRAEADLARANQSLTLAQNIYRLNQAQLANIIGISVFIQLVPDENDIKIKEIFKDCFDLNKAKELAMKNRPDLQSIKFDIEAARQNRNSAYSIYSPDLTLFGEVARQGTLETGTSPNKFGGLRVQWNGGTSLGLNGYTEAKARTAKLQETRLNYIITSRNIEENLVKTFFNTVTARSLIDSTWAELQSAAESRNISVVRLKAGIGTFIDVLQTQSTYTTSKINHLNAVIGYDISQVELLYEMGVISPDNILEGFNSSGYIATK